MENGHSDSAIGWNDLLLPQQASGRAFPSEKEDLGPAPVSGSKGTQVGHNREESVWACSPTAVGAGTWASSSRKVWGLQIGHSEHLSHLARVAFALKLSGMAPK